MTRHLRQCSAFNQNDKTISAILSKSILIALISLPAEQEWCSASMEPAPPKRAGGRTRNLANTGTVCKANQRKQCPKHSRMNKHGACAPQTPPRHQREVHACSAGRVAIISPLFLLLLLLLDYLPCSRVWTEHGQAPRFVGPTRRLSFRGDTCDCQFSVTSLPSHVVSCHVLSCLRASLRIPYVY